MNVITTRYKVNDRLPEYTAELTQGTGTSRVPIPLAGVTVKLQLRDRASGALKVDADATVDDAGLGKVRYAWDADDLDTVGTYDAYWELTFSGARKMTVPSEGADQVIVEDYP